MIKVVLIDNYDSFTFNLFQAIAALKGGPQVEVLRNDAVTADTIGSYNPTHLLVSPGPCTPDQAGNSCDVIEKWAGRLPILGVCLGHQCVAHVFGGVVTRSPVPVHGKSSLVYHDGRTVYRGLPNPLEAGRYHSLVVDPNSVPPVLETSATTSDGIVMGVRHREYVVEGIQFHPESILTEVGNAALRNFLSYRQPVWPGDEEDG